MAEGGKLSPEQRRGVFVVWLIIFIDLMGFGIVLPSLAYFVKLFEMPGWALSAGSAVGLDSMRGGVLVGMIMTAYSLCQFIFAPLWGRLSDKVGRKPVLAISTAGFSVTWIMFALAPNFTVLLASRALAGVFAANLSTAQAYMADVFPPERRAKGMGLIGMAFGLGFVFGPAIGGALSSDWFLGLLFEPGTVTFARSHLFMPAFFAAGLSACSFLLAVIVMRESLSPEDRAKLGPRQSRLVQFFAGLRKPAIGPMLLVYFVVTLGFANLEAMFGQFNADYLQISQDANMWVFVSIGLTLAFVQGGLIGRLTKAFGSPKVLLIGLAGLAGAMFIFGFQRELNPNMNAYVWLLLVSVLIGVFNALCNPNILAIISSHAARDAQGGTMGFTASAATLGRILGPIIGGVVYDAAGPQWPFAVGGALIGLGLLIYIARWKTVAAPAAGVVVERG
jgi:MFS transporter, DHA1 family, tetracycline resistance protein